MSMREVNMTPAALVLGGGIAGMEAALRLADAGKTGIPGRAGAIHRWSHAQLYKTFPTLDCAA